MSYGSCDFVPDILHAPFQVGLVAAAMFLAHGFAHINDVDGGFLVRHDCRAGEAA